MNEDRRQILEMLASGKITADEAERLIEALSKSSPEFSAEEGKPANKPKYLRVLVESGAGYHGSSPTKVNVRIPIQLLRAGVKLASLIPVQAREHINQALRENGINGDITQIKPENLEELIDHINEFTVDVDEQHSKVRVFCE